jgi:chitinase
MHDLTAGSLDHFDSLALGINDRGEVVGYFIDDGPNPFTQDGFLYKAGQTLDLFPLGISVASAINNSGQMVGESALNSAFPNSGVVFRYEHGQILFQATLGNPVRAFGINNRRQVVGDGYLFGYFVSHAFLYSGGQIQDLGALGSDSSLNSSVAFGINDHGQIVGSSDIVPNVSHAFLYSGGKMRDLGTLGETNSYALGINNRGKVVGCSSPTGSNATLGTSGLLPFVYIAGQMVDLNELLVANPAGWIIIEADSINDAGQIAVTGVTPSGLIAHALLLSPVHGY